MTNPLPPASRGWQTARRKAGRESQFASTHPLATGLKSPIPRVLREL
jgi:hypothetical protein